MIFLELDGQLAAAGLDVGTAGRPALVQSGSTPTISRIGRFAGSVSGRSANRTPKRVAEVLLQRGVVGLRRGHGGLEQHPSVDGQPASVEGLHLVRDRDVGVQIRVAGSAVPVGERGRRPGLGR